MSDTGFLHFKEVSIVSSLRFFLANYYYCYHDQMNPFPFSQFALIKRIIIIAHLSQKNFQRFMKKSFCGFTCMAYELILCFICIDFRVKTLGEGVLKLHERGVLKLHDNCLASTNSNDSTVLECKHSDIVKIQIYMCFPDQ